MNIISAGGITPGTTDTPLDARTRINNFSELPTIINPYIGMVFYVVNENKYYMVKSLKDKTVGNITIPNGQVATYNFVYDEIPRAADKDVVKLQENQSITGKKIFNISPEVPLPINNIEVANKEYVDKALLEKANTRDVALSLLYLNPHNVSTKDDLYTTFQNPPNGGAVLILDEGYIYQFRVDIEPHGDWVKTPYKDFPKDVATKSDLVTLSSKSENNIYNVTSLHPITGFYTAELARKAVLKNFRKSGLIITFEIYDNLWIQEQFSGNNIAEWNKNDLWLLISKDYSDKVFNIDGQILSVLFTSLSKALTGGITDKGEYWLKNLLTDILKIGSTSFSTKKGNDLLIHKDNNGKAISWIDKQGISHIPYLETAGITFSSAQNGELFIVADSSGSPLAWIEKNGTINIPHLKLRGSSLPEDLGKTLEKLQMQTNYNSAVISGITNLSSRYLETCEREDQSVLRVVGEWTTPANIDIKKKIIITITDDDGYDFWNRASTSIDPYKGGFYSRLLPIAISKKIPMNEAYILNAIRDAGPHAYNEARYVQDIHGWEILSHSKNHDWPIYNVADTVERYFKNKGTDVISNMDEANKYFVDQWDRQPFLDLGLNIKNGCDFAGGTTTNRIRKIQRAAGYHCVLSNNGFSASPLMNIPPLSQFAIYRNGLFERNGGDSVTNFITQGGSDINAALNNAKQKIDELVAIGTGGWLDLYTHAYLSHWCNYNPDYDDPDYPINWRKPFLDPGTPGKWNDINLPNGWEPAPNTALRVLWDFIDYAKSKGVEFMTVDNAISYWGNLVDVGDFTWGKRKVTFDPFLSNHYVIGMNGKSSYRNI